MGKVGDLGTNPSVTAGYFEGGHCGGRACASGVGNAGVAGLGALRGPMVFPTLVGAQSRCRCGSTGRGEPSRRGSCAWPDGEPAKSSSRRHRIRRPLGRSRRPGRRSTEREVHRPVGELPVPRLRRRPPSCRFRWPTMLPKWRLHFASLEAASSPLPRFSADRPGPGFGLTGRRGTNDAARNNVDDEMVVSGRRANCDGMPRAALVFPAAPGPWLSCIRLVAVVTDMPGGGDADRRRHVRWSVAHAPV